MFRSDGSVVYLQLKIKEEPILCGVFYFEAPLEKSVIHLGTRCSTL